LNKILIITALMLGVSIVAFWRRIVEEFQLLKGTKATELMKELIFVFFEPMSQQERKEKIKHSINQLRHIQEQVSKSLIAKHFVDYRDYILKRQKEMEKAESVAKEQRNAVSFSTPMQRHIVARSEFPKEQLLQLGFLIDESFSDEEEMGLYTLKRENNRLVLEMSSFESFNADNQYQGFVNQLAEDVFQDEHVLLRVGSLKTVEENCFESE